MAYVCRRVDASNLHSVNDLVWDGDLNPEGAAVNFLAGDEVERRLNGAVLWAEERSSDDDTILFGAQAAVEVANVLLGAGVFAWDSMEGFAPLFDESDGFGNSTVGVNVDPMGEEDLRYATDFMQIEALARIKVGKAKDPGSLAGGYDYRELEKDAVVGAFSDSKDFDRAQLDLLATF